MNKKINLVDFLDLHLDSVQVVSFYNCYNNYTCLVRDRFGSIYWVDVSFRDGLSYAGVSKLGGGSFVLTSDEKIVLEGL